MKSNEVYSIGWNHKHQLECTKDTIKYATSTNNDEVKVIVCDMNNKKMVLCGKGSNSRIL